MNKTYTFNLNEQQIQTIITALQEMPLKHSLDAFMTLQQQAAQQLQEDPDNGNSPPVNSPASHKTSPADKR